MKMPGSAKKTSVFFSVLYAIVFLISASLMSVEKIGDTGYAITPDLLFALSIVCGIVCTQTKDISVIAFIFGVISDIFVTPPMHLSPLLFFAGAYFSSKTVGVFTRTNAFTVALASLPFFAVRAVVGCIYVLSNNLGVKLTYVLTTTVLPEFAVNAAAAFVLYIIVNFLYKRFKRRFYLM